MTAEPCCRGRSCPECKRLDLMARAANDFRDWLAGKYDKKPRKK